MPQEKEILKIAYALYQKRVDFNPKFAGNRLDFVSQFKKLCLLDQASFALAVDNWIDEAIEDKSTGLTGINNFLKSGEWEAQVTNVSYAKLGEMSDAIDKNYQVLMLGEFPSESKVLN